MKDEEKQPQPKKMLPRPLVEQEAEKASKERLDAEKVHSPYGFRQCPLVRPKNRAGELLRGFGRIFNQAMYDDYGVFKAAFQKKYGKSTRIHMLVIWSGVRRP